MTTVPFDDFATVKLDASGNGTASVGPLSAREVWTLQAVHVFTVTNVKEAACNLYVGPDTGRRYYRGGTFSGSSGDTTGLTDTLKVGDKVWAVWTGGDAGTTATMNVTGTKEV